MATKKSDHTADTSAGERDRNKGIIEDRVKAREEAVTQEGVTPPTNGDVNELPG
jgi:hypothetical protein